MSSLVLHAPLAGWAAPLDEVPDPVFAQRMMGAGIAIDPTEGVLVAPCDATVVQIHAARHALTLRTSSGLELLLHVGLETVALRGDGFTTHVSESEAVRQGQTLLTFDLDAVARAAPSLVTPVIVTNPERFTVEVLAEGREVAIGEPILRATAHAGGFESADPVDIAGADEPRAVRQALLTHSHGLHARPAARIAGEAKRWRAQVAISVRGKRAGADSPVSLMTLGASAGDVLEILAEGPDAASAAAAIADMVAAINAAPAEATAALTPPGRRGPAGTIQGVPAAPGLAVGPAWRLTLPEPPLAPAAGRAQDLAALERALSAATAELGARLPRLTAETRAVTEAHLALLSDPALQSAARLGIQNGLSAGAAWRAAIEDSVLALEASGDPRLAERALDLRDLERRVLWALAGRAPEPQAPPRGAILIADDLMPGDLAGLDGAGLSGVCTARGGPTSHVAILAAAMGPPAVVAAGPAILEVAEGATVVLDGDAGRLEPSPAPARVKSARAELAKRARRAAAERAAAAAPARLADDTRIEVFANIGSLADAALAACNGAEGCGLLRTEFLFLDRATPPTREEQAAAYQAIAQALEGRPVIVRTLDVGGDKPAPYLKLPTEENPALGIRGLRVGLRQPELLLEQLRAILAVRPAGQCRLMAPMVTSLAEVAAFRELVQKAAGETGHEAPIALGVMIETPAAAATADLIAREVDFVSIGTNDLAQYALAMDRGNPSLAPEVDGLHPAVLRLIRLACEGAARHARPVGVCGGLASDPAAVPILVGLGVSELSVTPARVAATKALVRTLEAETCRKLALDALDKPSAAAVRALVAQLAQSAPS